MMKFPLLKMQHYRVIVGKLLSTIQMTEVSKLFLQKNTSMVRSSFRSGYTSKASHTFGPDFCSFYSKFSLNRHLYDSDYYSIKNGNVRCGKEQGEMADSLLGQNWMYFYLSQLWFTVQCVFMIHFFLVLPDTSFVVSAKKVLESGIAWIACAYLFFFLQKNSVDCARLQEEAEQWELFITRDENIQAQAAATQKFWQECPAKISVSCQWRQ